MMLKHLLVSTLMFSLLAGCVTKPNGDLEDGICKLDFHDPSTSDPLGELGAIFGEAVGDLFWFMGCEAVIGARNGVHHIYLGAHHLYYLVHTHDGVYRSPDGAFSVGMPSAEFNEYEAQEQPGTGRDSVVFVPYTHRKAIYSVTVLRHLDEAQAGLSLADFSNQSNADLLRAGVTMGQIHAEDVQLDAGPARLVVYRSQVPDADPAHPSYYLAYFIKTAHTAALLSVMLPYDCPACASGPESAVREVDPDLDAFLKSFQLTDASR